MEDVPCSRVEPHTSQHERRPISPSVRRWKTAGIAPAKVLTTGQLLPIVHRRQVEQRGYLSWAERNLIGSERFTDGRAERRLIARIGELHAQRSQGSPR